MPGRERSNAGTSSGQVLGVEPVPRPVLLTSRLLSERGIPHCFTTRLGGYSVGGFATLNFGNPGELAADDSRRDKPATIGRNLELVLQVMGAAGREVVQVHQVHGAGVHVVRRGEASHWTGDGVPDGTTTKADAVVTDDAARLAGVRVADCAPVLLAGFDGGGVCVGVAAVHAGWRGAVAGIAERAVDSLRDLGAKEIAAAIGPCIGRDAFEVGPEVAAAFQERFGFGTRLLRERGGGGGGGKFDVDLAGSVREQMMVRGVPADRIEVLGYCTMTRSDLFFSHRRERGMTGRMIALVGMKSR